MLHFWGKARPQPDASAAWHPLVYHSLDVAAVGEAVLAARPDLVRGLSAMLGWPSDALRRLIVYLLALHDIGKISRPFQGQVPELWPADALGPFEGTPLSGPRHDEAGLYFLVKHFAEASHAPFAGWNSDIDGLFVSFVGHHGRPVAYPEQLLDAQVFGQRGRAAARAFLETMFAIFSPEPLPQPPNKALARASWRIAGLAVLCDWIGSNQAWFRYSPPDLEPAEYLELVARPSAARALRASGVAAARPSTITGYRALTRADHVPSPVQRWAEEVGLPDGPCLILVEDMTGGGKTEAALVARAPSYGCRTRARPLHRPPHHGHGERDVRSPRLDLSTALRRGPNALARSCPRRHVAP